MDGTAATKSEETSTCRPSCFVRAPRRAATLTARLITVKSNRVREPIFPYLTSPRCIPIPYLKTSTLNVGFRPLAEPTPKSFRTEHNSQRYDSQARQSNLRNSEEYTLAACCFLFTLRHPAIPILVAAQFKCPARIEINQHGNFLVCVVHGRNKLYSYGRKPKLLTLRMA
ncbi:hypothetical protein D3C78_1316420 [compost metagenome]